MGFYFKRDTEFDDLFRAAAKTHASEAGMTVGGFFALLKGIAAVESEYDPRSILHEPSHTTAGKPTDTDASRGLMQTTEEVARDRGWPKGKPYDGLFDPATSIEFGCREIIRYLKNPLVNVKPASLPTVRRVARPVMEQALSAYNMGYPRSILSTTEHLAKQYGYPFSYKTKPPEGWFFANQSYVNQVLSYRTMYDALERGDKTTAGKLREVIKKKGSTGKWA